jgi:uncharacterized protein YebE (UPF0316 family)
MLADTWMPVIIFASRICDVSLGTLRMICVVRGQKLMAVVLGFFETLIWILAVSGVLAHLHHLSNIVAYAAGFAAGNAVGMWIEAHLALGTQAISFVSRGTANAVAQGLRLADYFVTALSGCGRDGPVSICHAVVPRRLAPAAMRIARVVDPDVVITVEDIRECSSMAPLPHIAGKFPLVPARRAINAAGHRTCDTPVIPGRCS